MEKALLKPPGVARTPPSPTPGAPEKPVVRSMFDRIAPRYDLLNRLLSLGFDVRWRKRAVEWLELRSPARVLDLCTGTADLLVEALRRDGAHRGVGVDLSTEMLGRGARKLAKRGLGERAWLAAGDGEDLPLGAASFDAALVAFGIRNIGDPLRALREVHRVLRRGGRLVVLEFSMPGGPLGPAYAFYFRHVLPCIGGLVSGDTAAYRYLPASVARFPERGEFGDLMAEAGFGRVAWQSLTGGVAHLYRGDKPL